MEGGWLWIFVLALGLLVPAQAAAGPGEGREQTLLAACPDSPNCVSSLATDARHAIPPLSFTGDPDRALARLKAVLARRGDTQVVEERDGMLRVEFHTTFFTDDGVFLLDPERGEIEVRSASRVGYWDLGKNRRRLEEIRAAFEAASRTSP